MRSEMAVWLSADVRLPERPVYHSHPFSPMRLTFVTDLGQTYTVEIDPKMELENVMALLEAEVSDFSTMNVSLSLVSPFDKSGIPVAEQSISYDGRELSNVKATMEGLGVSDDAMLLIRRKVSVAGRCAS